jgi:hypothetical protein
MSSRIISVRDIKEALGDGYSMWQVRRLLRHAGAVRKIGRRWYTSPETLRQAFPEMFEAILERVHVESAPDDAIDAGELEREIEALREALAESNKQVDFLCERLSRSPALFRTRWKQGMQW